MKDNLHARCHTDKGDGLCMYQWECHSSGGQPVGICKHGFQFGACCTHDSKVNEVSDLNLQVSKFPSETTADVTTAMNSSSSIDNAALESIGRNCGLSSKMKSPKGRIVNGTRAYLGEFPWQVSVMVYKDVSEGFQHHCGGVLLNERWVATAAHCVVRTLLVELQVRVGEYDFSRTDSENTHFDLKIEKIVLHPNYTSNVDVFNITYENDIAILKLRNSVNFKEHIRSICLPTSSDLLVGKSAVVTGWGRKKEDGNISDILLKIDLPILSNAECEILYAKAGLAQQVPDIFMCAGFAEGSYDSCSGDSGGPLQTLESDGRYVLSGLVSWGHGCGEPNKPGVYTRISKFVSWIIDNIKD